MKKVTIMKDEFQKQNALIYRSNIYTILTLIALFFYSCQSNELINSGSSQKIKIETPDTINFIGHWYTEGKRLDLVKDVVREYEFTHQGVHINLKFPDELYFDRSDPQSNQKYVASIVYDPNPKWDIIMINNAYQPIADITKDPDWPKKTLVDFSEIPEFRKNTISSLLSDSIKQKWHGIIPGPFIEGVNWALWCNTAVAEKVGISVKQFDMTFDDFIGYVKAVDEYNKKNKDDIIALYEASDWKTVDAFVSQLYASELDDEKEFFSDAFSVKKLEAWFRTLKALEQLSAYKPLPNVTKPWDSGEGIINDKCLFFSNGSWMYNIWIKSNKNKMVDIMPCEYPVFKPTKFYLGAYQIIWAVLKNAKHKDKAIKFLLAWNTPSVAEKWSKYTKCPTGIKESFISGSFGFDKFSQFTKHIDSKYGSRKYGTESSRYIYGFSQKDKPNYYEDVLLGKITADRAIQNIKAIVRK